MVRIGNNTNFIAWLKAVQPQLSPQSVLLIDIAQQLRIVIAYTADAVQLITQLVNTDITHYPTVDHREYHEDLRVPRNIHLMREIMGMSIVASDTNGGKGSECCEIFDIAISRRRDH